MMNKKLPLLSSIIAIMALSAFKDGNCRKDAEQEQLTENELITQKETAPAFVYDVDSRFLKTVTKTDLQNATTVFDLFTVEETNGIASFSDVAIVARINEQNVRKKGPDGTFTSEQRSLLKAIDYSTNFNIEAFCKRRNEYTGELEKFCFVYYITLLPEVEATYKTGKDDLINYLKENSKTEAANANKDELKPGKVQFTITASGEVDNVILESTSGDEIIDDKMMTIIEQIPGEWTPATDAAGNAVEQTLIFSYGIMGC